jgi:hypothetical protein
MNLNNILNLLNAEDPEAYEKLSERRNILKSFGTKVAVAAAPFALGAFFNKAYGKSTGVLYDALAFAISLEYLEAAFYKKAMEDMSFIPTQYQASITKLAQDELAHVEFLKRTIEATNSVVPTAKEYDFTAGYGKGNGAFPDVFTNFDTFLAVAQLLEDTGVRGYKGQIPGLSIHNDFLLAIMRLHGTESNHAAHIRYIRRVKDHTIRPWITGSQTKISSPFGQNTYNGEERITQYNTSLVNYRGYDLPTDRVTEAFDEPLLKEEVQKIMEPFIVVP